MHSGPLSRDRYIMSPSAFLGGVGQLRLSGRGAVWCAGRGRLLPGVPRRVGGKLRAAAVRAREMVVLGLVTTKRGQMENPDDLKPRIDEEARFPAA
jgi:hypothetical protein